MKKIIVFFLYCSVSLVAHAYWPGHASYLSSDCPKDKPFEGRWGTGCMGCDTKTPMLIEKGHKKDFEICHNRVTIGNTSYLKTGNGLEVWEEEERRWNPCKEVILYEAYAPEEKIAYYMDVLEMEEKDCALCAPYRIYEDGECVLVKSPLLERPLIQKKAVAFDDDWNPVNYSYYLRTCDTKESDVKALPEDCEKCPNREYKDGFCVLKKQGL